MQEQKKPALMAGFFVPEKIRCCISKQCKNLQHTLNPWGFKPLNRMTDNDHLVVIVLITKAK